MSHDPADRIGRRAMTRRDFLWLAGVSAAGAALPGALSGCAVDPTTGEKILVGLSEQDEIALDRQHSPHQFSRDYGAVQDDALNRYVNDVNQSLASRSHRPNVPYSARAVNATYINAYTFPGGSIAATRGILLEMQSEDELAGLLGHELGHVNARHTAQRAGQSLIAQTAVTVATVAAQSSDYAAATPLVQILGSIGASALLASYSRDNERQADALGLEYMTGAGYNPGGMVDLMQLLNRQGQSNPGLVETMFASHPMSSERLASTTAAAQSRYASFAKKPIARERYMDSTVRLRADKPAIEELQKGETLMQKRDLPGAEGHFSRALQYRPNDYAGLCMMTRCQLAQKRVDDAAQFAARARAVNPREAQAMQLAGVTHLASRRFAQAYQELDAYDKQLPGDGGVAFLKGVSLESMQNRRAAAQEYARFVRAGGQGSQAEYAMRRLKEWGYVR